MATAFDDRLVTLQIKLKDQTVIYDQEYYIIASGLSMTNGLFGDAAIRIDNISKTNRDFLVAQTSPWPGRNTTPADVSLSVGRESYGTFQIFSGACIASNPTQPPDIGLTLRCISQSNLLGIPNVFSAPNMATVKTICEQVAAAAGLSLNYQATTNPNIGNYHFTGAIGKQIQDLKDLGISAYIPQGGNVLVVTDYLAPRNDLELIQINSSTGMIGVPEVTETGIRVKMLINNQVQIGNSIQITSALNPVANGTYFINQLGFEIASRDTPFYWIIDAPYPDLGAPLKLQGSGG